MQSKHEDLGGKQPKKRSIRRYMLMGCGTVAVLVVAVIVWIAVSLFSGPGLEDMTEFHPFRSAEAKERFLALYDLKAKEWPVASETRMVETSYGPTFVRISGPAGAPPLVLLHGVGGNSLQWMPNIEALSESHRTYAVDNIYDNGRSVFTRAMEVPEDYVAWLDDLFAGLGLEADISIVGLSYGSWIASQYALHRPERLRKLVLLAPAGTVLRLSGEWMLRAALCAVPHRYFARSFLYWLLEDLAESGEAGRALIEEHADESYLALRSFKTKRMVNPTVLTDEELRSIGVPTLYMVGENEKVCSAEEAVARLNRVAPGIRTAVIPGAGHDLTLVKTEMVNGKILAFLLES